EPLGGGNDVRDDRQALCGEPVPGAADAGDDLVEADQEAVALATFGEAFPEPLRRTVGRECCSTDRLAEIRGHVFGTRGLERAVESLQGLLTSGIEPPRA